MNGFVIGTNGNADTAALGDCLGPGIANVDFSFYKNFKLTERVGLQFRLEFYNLFNTTQFLGNSSGATDLNNTLNNGGTARNYTTTQNSNGTTTYTPCATGVNTICGYDLFNQYGQAFKDRGPREIQYALKLTF